MKNFITIILLVLSIGGYALADDFVLEINLDKDVYAGTIDSWMNSTTASQGTNYGSDANIACGINTYSYSPVVGVPSLSDSLALGTYSGVTWDSAFIGLVILNDYVTTNDTLSLTGYALKRTIVETEVCWNDASSGVSWTTAGAKDETDDRYAWGSSSSVFIVDTSYSAGDTVWVPVDHNHLDAEEWVIEWVEPSSSASSWMNMGSSGATVDANSPTFRAYGHTTATPKVITIGEVYPVPDIDIYRAYFSR